MTIHCRIIFGINEDRGYSCAAEVPAGLKMRKKPAGGKLVINPLRAFIEESFSARLSR